MAGLKLVVVACDAKGNVDMGDLTAKCEQHSNELSPVLYTGRKDFVAHECIIDLRNIKDTCGVSVDDVAKRLIDYGFHAPTMS